MKKLIRLCSPLLLLSACAMSFDTFEEAWPYLKGQNINLAIDHLGVPNQKYPIDDKEVYVWSTSENIMVSTPTTMNTNGNIGLNQFNATTTGYSPQIMGLSCQIRILTHKKIIEHMDYEGSNGTCMRYADRLNALIKGTK